MLTYIYILAFSYAFATQTGIPQFIAFVFFNRDNKSLKPFTCAACLSFWSALVYSIGIYKGYHELTTVINLIGPAFVLFVLAGIFENLIRRYVI